jgi:NTP pyrophosphatase (non-canonical NTP hydrolase)
MKEIEALIKKIDDFAKERDWDQFHSPKNLAIALSVEASELLEEFQWLTEEQSNNLSVEKISKIKDEIGDTFNYLLRLSSKLNIDIIDAANQKIEKNAIKYPVEKSRGNAKKYTEFE